MAKKITKINSVKTQVMDQIQSKKRVVVYCRVGTLLQVQEGERVLDRSDCSLYEQYKQQY